MRRRGRRTRHGRTSGCGAESRGERAWCQSCRDRTEENGAKTDVKCKRKQHRNTSVASVRSAARRGYGGKARRVGECTTQAWLMHDVRNSNSSSRNLPRRRTLSALRPPPSALRLISASSPFVQRRRRLLLTDTFARSGTTSPCLCCDPTSSFILPCWLHPSRAPPPLSSPAISSLPWCRTGTPGPS